jgi:hypothetical protein
MKGMFKMKSKHLILSAIVALAGFLAQTRASASILVTIRPPLAPPTGQVTGRFDVGTDLQGLTYADQNLQYGPTLFYSIRNDTLGNSTLTTISSLTSTTAGQLSVGNHAFDAVTFAAPDVGYGPTILYSLSHDNAGNSTFGTIQPTGVPYTALFGVGLNFDALTFSATDVGYGANLFYSLSHDNAGNSTFGTINPTPGGIVTPLFIVGRNFDELVFTSTDVGYGANMFYYLRTDASGNSVFGTINGNADFQGTRVVDRFNLGAPFEELTFTTTDVGYGANLFYSLSTVPEPSSFWPGACCASLFAWQWLVVWRRKAARS